MDAIRTVETGPRGEDAAPLRSGSEPSRDTPMALMRHVRQLLGTTHDLYECRNCGTTLEPECDCCTNCGSEEIARYDIEYPA
ncbi:MAG: hypothetical protein ACI8UR_000430 [Natronomonas sp.]|jgi:hypothetical protein